MFRVPALPIIRSTIVQLTLTGKTYITLDGEMYGNVHFKVVPETCTDIAFKPRYDRYILLDICISIY
jgi:hypothetical protein